MRSLLPVYFREPSVNLGIGDMAGRPPHLVGEAFLKAFGIAPKSRLAHAFTFLDFAEAAHRYGRLGGFAHLKTLIDRLRAEAGAGALAAARRRRSLAGQRARQSRCTARTWWTPPTCWASRR